MDQDNKRRTMGYVSPESGLPDDTGSPMDGSGSTSSRVLDRKRVYVDLPVFDANRHQRKGYVIDITSRGIGLKKIHTSVDDVINWVVCADEHFPVERFSFVAKCRWTSIDKLNNDPLSGFQIIRISPEDSARLRRFLLFLGSRYFKDLTSHLRSEEALRSVEARYRSIVESQSELIVRFTPDARLIFANQAFCNFVRKDKDELVGSQFFDWVVSSYQFDPKACLSGLTDNNPVTTCEFGMRHPSGLIRHFEWSALRFFDDHETSVFYQLVGRDITEKKSATDQLLRSKAELEASNQKLRDELSRAKAKPDAIVESQNTSSGKTSVTTSGTKSGDLLHDSLDNKNVHKNGESLRTIADRSNLGPTVNEMMAYTKTHSGKMEAMGTLAAGIAHDVNNALFVMTGYADLALGEATSDSRMANYIRSILKAGQRIKEMVNQILTFSRGGNGEKKPLHLSPLLKGISKYMRGAIPGNVQLEERMNCPHDLVEGNPTQLYELIVNLVVMARDSMIDSGGRLLIGLDNIDINEPGSDAVKQLTPGKYARLTIRHTGRGISQEVVNQIANPFISSDQIASGNGIGLPMIHFIVNNHHAVIDVQSEIGTGTEFRVYFKIFKEESDSTQRRYFSDNIQGFERILYVDDEPPILEMSKQLLALMGYSVTTASSGIEALDIIGKPGSDFDLVITDMTMPGMTGIQLAGEIRKTHPSLPIILCSGYTDIVAESEASGMGISAYMNKPMEKNELSTTIRKLLDSH